MLILLSVSGSVYYIDKEKWGKSFLLHKICLIRSDLSVYLCVCVWARLPTVHMCMRAWLRKLRSKVRSERTQFDSWSETNDFSSETVWVCVCVCVFMIVCVCDFCLRTETWMIASMWLSYGTWQWVQTHSHTRGNYASPHSNIASLCFQTCDSELTSSVMYVCE